MSRKLLCMDEFNMADNEFCYVGQKSITRGDLIMWLIFAGLRKINRPWGLVQTYSKSFNLALQTAANLSFSLYRVHCFQYPNKLRHNAEYVFHYSMVVATERIRRFRPLTN